MSWVYDFGLGGQFPDSSTKKFALFGSGESGAAVPRGVRVFDRILR
jgi:hypothetical protein